MAPKNQYTNERTVLTDAIMTALAPWGIEPSLKEVELFATLLVNLKLQYSALQVQGRVAYGTMDILRFIKEAQDIGAMDEALWRAFLAAHFGRPSAGNPDEVESAGRFLCAFGQRPTWTWTSVSSEHSAFVDQLYASEAKLKTLRFGNHRKYRSPRPHALAEVVNSFVQWVRYHGGSPSAAFTPQQEGTPEQGFRELYHRFDVDEFGRLGRFDLLNLLGMMGLLNIQPDSCYLVGSTGPLAGAKKLCGKGAEGLSDREISKIIDNLACRLGISYSVIEDTLCLWQKKPRKRMARLPPDAIDSSFVPIQDIRRAVKQ